MNSQNDKEGSGHVKAAVIGGLFAVLAACVGGIFLLLNTMVDNGVIVFGMSNPSVLETPTANESINISSGTQNVSIAQPPAATSLSLLPTSTPLPPAPNLPEGYISIGKYFSGKVDSGGKAGNKVYSHFISGKIKYTRISADDDIDRIVLICTDTSSDITEKFFPIPKPEGEIFPNYASETLEISTNCRVDFYVVDTIGLQTGISVYAEAVP